MIKYIILLIVLLSIAQGNAQADWQQKIDVEVWAVANTQTDFEFFVLLKDQANTKQAKALKTKEAKGSFVYNLLQNKANETQGNLMQILQQKQALFRPYFIVNGIWVKGNLALLEELAKQEEVANIMPNPPIKNEITKLPTTPYSAKASAKIEWGILKIEADKVWQKNIKGAGVVIGGQDTGYEWEHPAIKNQYRGDSTNHNYHWHDAIHGQLGSSATNPCGYDSKEPCDDHTHGTHTMGTMVGDDGGNNKIGVAPLATWVGCRNMDNGWGSPASYIECFEWFMAPTDTNNLNADPSQAPHVIANSWGCPPSEGCNSSNFAVMELAVENLKNAGVFIVVSAGNSGSSCNTIDNPAAIYEASFTVGATDSGDTLTGFSSRGNVTSDSSFRMKPNVVAPGRSVRSCVPNGGYQSYSGTSMAGPHVAGAVALLIAAQPNLAGNVDSLETILEMTADTIIPQDTCGNTLPTQIPNNMVGYGRINVYKALEHIRPDLFIGISKIETNQLQIYPNPLEDRIEISVKQPLGSSMIRISNLIGQNVYATQREINQRTTLNLEFLPKGIYIISISNDSQQLTSKIIKR